MSTCPNRNTFGWDDSNSFFSLAHPAAWLSSQCVETEFEQNCTERVQPQKCGVDPGCCVFVCFRDCVGVHLCGCVSVLVCAWMRVLVCLCGCLLCMWVCVWIGIHGWVFVGCAHAFIARDASVARCVGVKVGADVASLAGSFSCHGAKYEMFCLSQAKFCAKVWDFEVLAGVFSFCHSLTSTQVHTPLQHTKWSILCKVLSAIVWSSFSRFHCQIIVCEHLVSCCWLLVLCKYFPHTKWNFDLMVKVLFDNVAILLLYQFCQSWQHPKHCQAWHFVCAVLCAHNSGVSCSSKHLHLGHFWLKPKMQSQVISTDQWRVFSWAQTTCDCEGADQQFWCRSEQLWRRQASVRWRQTWWNSCHQLWHFKSDQDVCTSV